MTSRGRGRGSAGARWLVSAVALAASLVLWVMLAASVREEPSPTTTSVATPDVVDAVDLVDVVVDVSTSASGRRRR